MYPVGGTKKLGPLSVSLPAALRRRLAAEAKRRGLSATAAARALLDERMSEVENAEPLSRADEWQRAEAWATWERFRAGDRREVSKAQLDEDFDAALARARA